MGGGGVKKVSRIIWMAPNLELVLNATIITEFDSISKKSVGEKGTAAFQAVLQCDGNFVIYTPKRDTSFWASRPTDSYVSLTLQDDGNLVIKNESDSIVWETYTASSCSVGSGDLYTSWVNHLLKNSYCQGSRK